MSVAAEFPSPISIRAQWAAWLVGLGLCLYGVFGGVALWEPAYAWTVLLIMAAAPICWGWPVRRRARQPLRTTNPGKGTVAATLCLLVLFTAGVQWAVMQELGDYPPEYHDEYSYLFQAKTFLAGRFWFPSHPTHPELFDQMHVLNDHGRMASRYFPGTGLWLAPFVAAGHPFFAMTVCSVIVTLCVFGAGWEAAGFFAGLWAGLLTALSPGLALFGSHLLAHHPTLLGLAVFLWFFLRWQRTATWHDAAVAACGLSWAMVCRPMTAAGFGLPFGVWTLWQLCRRETGIRQKAAVTLAFAVPLAGGIVAQLAYNQAVTGQLTDSPYQLYTDLYTPRHVYGFNNVIRGEQRLGDKVLTKYDAWAENLTPQLALSNETTRLFTSLLMIWDLLPMTLAAVVFLMGGTGWPRSVWLSFAGIVSLHVAHIPYWYAGIMGWHYVFESLILRTLLAGAVVDRLWQEWTSFGQTPRKAWLVSLVLVTVLNNLCSVPGIWTSKLTVGINSSRYARSRLAEFRTWIDQATKERPALVLVAPHRDDLHLDFVTNDPGLNARLLLGRYSPGKTDLASVVQAFPGRQIYVCEPDTRRIRLVE